MAKKKSSDFPPELAQDAENGPDPAADLVEGEGALEDDTGEPAEGSSADLSEDEKEEAVADKLNIFGVSLSKTRDEWIAARASAGLDNRWVDDLDQYNGKDSANRAAAEMMTSVEQGFPVTTHAAKPTRSTVYVQVTRQKTNAAAARLADVLLPTDEPNFSIQPTPLPRLPMLAQKPVPAAAAQVAAGSAPTGNSTAQMPGMPTVSNGPMSGMSGAQNAGGQGGAPTASEATGAASPATPAAAGAPPAGTPNPLANNPDPNDPDEIARQNVLQQQAIAKSKADAMQAEILDCFEECDINAEHRKNIFNMALFGTGVLKGPIVIKKTRKAWSKKTDQTGKPYWVLEVAEDLSPNSFAIDPRKFWPDPACGDNVQNGRGAFELEMKSPKQVRELAKQPEYLKSQLIKVLDEGPSVGRALTRGTDDAENVDAQSDDIFEHWIYWGEVKHEDLILAGAIKPNADGEIDPEDKLRVVSACVEMINSTVIRAYLNPNVDDELPYDMVAWERMPGHAWGYGIPYLMRAQQRVINTAWRMILDNAGVSAGPQVVVKRGSISPADKNWAITSRKIWYATDAVDDVTKAFATFEFNMHLEELSKILEMAERLVDEETAVPQIAQGSQQGAPETVGVANAVMQGANVVLKRLVKGYDDYGTKPHVRRYYDYLMEYSDKDEIKGDFQIVALGSSSLVVKDIQNQAITNMLALAGNPAYSPFINRKKLFEKALKSQHIDPADVMNSDAEIDAAIKAASNVPPDPRIQAAELRSEADKARTESQQATAQAAIEAKKAIALDVSQMRLKELEMERDIEILRASQKENITVTQVKAQLAAVAIRERATTERQANDIAAKAGAAAPAAQPNA